MPRLSTPLRPVFVPPPVVPVATFPADLTAQVTGRYVRLERLLAALLDQGPLHGYVVDLARDVVVADDLERWVLLAARRSTPTDRRAVLFDVQSHGGLRDLRAFMARMGGWHELAWLDLDAEAVTLAEALCAARVVAA